LDIMTRTLSLFVWFRLFWYEPRLAFNGTDLRADWDPASMWLQPDPHDLWIPDVSDIRGVKFGQAAFGDVQAFLHDEQFAAKAGYNVFYSRPGILQSKCEVDLTWFPFDSQQCTLDMQPWAQGPADILLRKAPAAVAWETKMEVKNEEYEVSNVNFHEPEKTSYASIGIWPSLKITLTLQRHPHYYVVTAIVPLALLALLASMSLWLPPQARTTFAVTVLLVMFATLISLAGLRPPVRQTTWLEGFTAVSVSWAILAISYSVMHDQFHLYFEERRERRKKQAEAQLGPTSRASRGSEESIEIGGPISVFNFGHIISSAHVAKRLAWLTPRRFMSVLDAGVRICLPGAYIVFLFNAWLGLKSERDFDILRLERASEEVGVLLYTLVVLVFLIGGLVLLTLCSVLAAVWQWTVNQRNMHSSTKNPQEDLERQNSDASAENFPRVLDSPGDGDASKNNEKEETCV